MRDIYELFGRLGVVPVVVLDDADRAIPLARALLEGGVPVMEVTYRTAAAQESIRRIAEAVPEMCVGAGTVLDVKTAERRSAVHRKPRLQRATAHMVPCAEPAVFPRHRHGE